MNTEFYIAVVGEVFDGYSEMLLGQEPVFVKHFALKDQQFLDYHYQRYFKKIRKRGVQTDEESLQLLYDNDLWSEKKENEIKSWKDERDHLIKTAQQLPLPSQRTETLGHANDLSLKIEDAEYTRGELIGVTAEVYATNRSHEHLLRAFVYRDKELTKPYYTVEDFEDLEASELSNVIKLRNSLHKRFSDENLQKATLLPFFSLYLPLCEDVKGFFGKPVINLTIPQLKITSFGRVFYSIFQYVDDIPEDIRQDPAKLLLFSDAQRNKRAGKGLDLKEDADASMVFGATKEDMKEVTDGKSTTLESALKQKGESLNMEDMIKLSGA